LDDNVFTRFRSNASCTSTPNTYRVFRTDHPVAGFIALCDESAPRWASMLLGHARIETTQLYARIRPPHLKHTVAFYEDRANRLLSITLTEQKAV